MNLSGEVFFLRSKLMKYDYLLVGAGLFSAVFAFEATKAGKKCLVLERRNHIGGNCFTKKWRILTFMYTAPIFSEPLIKKYGIS